MSTVSIFMKFTCHCGIFFQLFRFYNFNVFSILIFVKKNGRDFTVNHDGHVWGSSGPAVLTRVLQQICGVKSPEQMKSSLCWGFHLMPRKKFYAVHYSNWKSFFDKKSTNSTLQNTEKSAIVHVWNKLSVGEKIKKSEERTAYEMIAMKQCPKVFEACGEYF